MVALVLLVLSLAQLVTEPIVTSVDPQGVRAGGSFVIQIDTKGSTESVVLTVYSQRFPWLEKHTSDRLFDNGQGDDAPQKGLIKYRIKTDATWLSTLGNNKDLSAAEERYGIALTHSRRVYLPKPQPPGLAAPSLQPIARSTVVTVFGSEGAIDEDAVIASDLASLTRTAVYLRLLAGHRELLWMRTDSPPCKPGSVTCSDSGSMWNADSRHLAIELPNLWLLDSQNKEFKAVDFMSGGFDKAGSRYLMTDRWDVAMGTEPKNLLQSEYASLRAVSRQFEESLSSARREQLKKQLSFLNDQLRALAATWPSPK